MPEKLTRRGFLGGAASAPIAAKEAYRKAIGFLEGEISLTPDPVNQPKSAQWVSRTITHQDVDWRAFFCDTDHYAKYGIPDFERQEWREQAEHSAKSYIDPDIQDMRSLSALMKRKMQARRNLKVLEESFWQKKLNDVLEREFYQMVREHSAKEKGEDGGEVGWG